jgi:hypothetical protein
LDTLIVTSMFILMHHGHAHVHVHIHVHAHVHVNIHVHAWTWMDIDMDIDMEHGCKNRMPECLWAFRHICIYNVRYMHIFRFSSIYASRNV